MIEFTLIVWLGVLLWLIFEIRRRSLKKRKHRPVKELIAEVKKEMDEFYQSMNELKRTSGRSF